MVLLYGFILVILTEVTTNSEDFSERIQGSWMHCYMEITRWNFSEVEKSNPMILKDFL